MGLPIRFHERTGRIPPIFAIWRRSGGQPKSMYSKSDGISKTIGEN